MLPGLALGSAAAGGQEPVRLEGRLVEAGTEFGLAGGRVQLGNGPVVPTGVDGRFDLDGVAPGTYVLTARAYGYGTRRLPLTLRGDTTLVIELQPAPIPLDSLLVEARNVTLEGEVLDAETGRALMDVEVTAADRGETRTDAHGHFEVDGIPAGPPFRLSVRGFGYLPVRTVVSASRDTSLVVELEPDPVARRMIEAQVGRIEERARPFRSTTMPALDREFMLSRGNATALDLVIERYGRRLDRVDCLLIDDQQRSLPGRVAGAGAGRSIGWSRRSGGGAGLEELAHFLAPEIERIEVLEYGAFPRGTMLRLYTRDFIRDMVARGGRVELAGPLYVGVPGEPLCQ